MASGKGCDDCRLLVADDHPHVIEALELLLKPEGFGLKCVRNPAAVIDALQYESFDGLLLDLNYSRDTTSGQEGLDLVSQVHALDPQVPVIAMTAWGNIELAVEAMRRGATDFIQKPWENARLLNVLWTQVELYRSQKQTRRLEAENQMLRTLRADGAPEMIAAAPAMRAVVEMIARIGPSDANVLVTGEHGTGKEVVAQTLHRVSGRAARPLVAVNTGALSEGTFESEMFGHVKGAFTDAKADRMGRFELADGGTLFLDEIANIPVRQQAKLLRVLETGELEKVGSSRTKSVDVRVLSATNADLSASVLAKEFREDLLFRLNTVEIRLPALRDRKEDIPALAGHFLARYAGRYRKVLHGVEASALQTMMAYAWPGNVRELDHTMERAVLMARGTEVEVGDLGLNPAKVGGASSLDDMSLEMVESVLIRKALGRANGNVSHAADALGLSRGALYRRIEKYGL
ncbi:DNA-binding transcriptional response regulator, NtrC family, contains REC, AAA-type ATPase, and a Fis-type DNA-binding domains [Granulicella pectinivorans]|jgi:DNA-binding NtrC family response regulator|uniref:DNA-binding transcriptional response regulator, NtrC family, contains REC, AAA-type ATPase, and a Fis-type DNA-binding domains n=1 Tax=Granulicella pectinivorans TaxID=474950 RepID=A0A1I6MY19_9BACT|nr:sigma-54 dependent transcriptional regulator [Granulicella pectinivorans]SFS20564.1 DNA-binding transcriptional response regulator, NtrC family, contains REC, AAA-type ATPase, and a Fis-type DNA-binding domains [Granulicella pectinivorans]